MQESVFRTPIRPKYRTICSPCSSTPSEMYSCELHSRHFPSEQEAEATHQRRESRLNSLFRVRKDRLESLTRINRDIYLRINSQQSHYHPPTQRKREVKENLKDKEMYGPIGRIQVPQTFRSPSYEYGYGGSHCLIVNDSNHSIHPNSNHSTHPNNDTTRHNSHKDTIGTEYSNAYNKAYQKRSTINIHTLPITKSNTLTISRNNEENISPLILIKSKKEKVLPDIYIH